MSDFVTRYNEIIEDIETDLSLRSNSNSNRLTGPKERPAPAPRPYTNKIVVVLLTSRGIYFHIRICSCVNMSIVSASRARSGCREPNPQAVSAFAFNL